ncbi:MAG: bifunctional hydroxymethylpyrimidine kinase/phosphomethylpyrimidine kinase [Kordiimonadaceae bacterium]|nr:bifunctional hydroxymethylpyrimidine kinase/phosphomethylpyrimidine kinase [Kordiimonadaceae bacterium]
MPSKPKASLSTVAGRATPKVGPRANKALGRVLVVAGSDPSGGAGVQADIKTITALGGYAATAITALTVQNTLGVTDIKAVAGAFVAAQMDAVLSDIGADALKTGMLFNAAIIRAVVQAIKKAGYAGPVIVDPVMVATSGDVLLKKDAITALKKNLLPITSLLTPNIPEAEALCGFPIKTDIDILKAGKAILAMGPKAVLIKGGHLPSEQLVDTLMIAGGEEMQIKSTRIESKHTHGTGCTMASALAAGLARGESTELAFSHAHAFVRSAILHAPGFGAGNGPLGHSAAWTSQKV